MHSYYVNQEVARHHYAELVREGAQGARAPKAQTEEAPPVEPVRWARRRLVQLRPALLRSF